MEALTAGIASTAVTNTMLTPRQTRIVFVLACNPHLPGCCTLIGIRPIRWWFAQYLLARKHRGYPQAHEDDAPRALRAALDIAEAVDQLELSITLPFDALAVRIGIATGTVVVGNIGSGARREEMAVVDETPNLAARLQAQASPGEIIIAAQTFRLVADYFDIDDLGEYKLKGISQPQTAYRVRGESGAQGRLDASASLGLTPLVGRKEEVAILIKRWAQAVQGESHLVMLSGEAGIGKSRVLRTFREKITDQPHSRALYHGSAYHQNSAFYPVIDQLERALRFESIDSVELRLEKLQSEKQTRS